LLRRLGVESRDPASDRELASALLRALESRAAAIDRIFFDWRGARDPGVQHYPSEPFRALAAKLEDRKSEPKHAYWSDAQPCSMHIDEVEAIWEAIAERDDWAPFESKVCAIRRMGEAMKDDHG
jgi:serine/tyrosine/threonine adenylyltransferase